MVSIDEQSPDISQGVTTAFETRTGVSGEDILNSQGAGDQGMMFGYACDETDDLMPLPIWLAHRLSHRLSEVRKAGVMPYLRPDGKTQVSVDYENGRPKRLRTVLISSQHQPGLDIETLLKPDLEEHVIHPLLPPDLDQDHYKLLANPTGSFVLGGPHADTGLTGRKIIVDTYGGAARHGGGAFSGKDPCKGDRSAAYAARYVAKNIVAAGLASKCEIQISYAIGVAKPTSRMAGHLEPLTRADLLIARGRNLDIITQAQSIESFAPLRTDLGRTSAAIYAAELVDRVTEEAHEAPEVFHLLVNVLGWLADRLSLQVAYGMVVVLMLVAFVIVGNNHGWSRRRVPSQP